MVPYPQLLVPANLTPPTEIEPTTTSQKEPFNEGIWTEDEELLYVNFVQANCHMFSKRNKVTRQMKPYVKMAKEISTRTPEQCRSHHQKKMRTYGTIPKLISRILRLLGYKATSKNNAATVVHAKIEDNAELECCYEKEALSRRVSNTLANES